MKTRTRFSKHKRYRVKSGKKAAKQSFKDECDINKIMAKYQKSGAITHFNRHAPQYGFATSNDFSESMRIVTEAQEMFSELPSKIRTRFANQPEQFLDFVQDPANEAEMRTLGLMSPKAESPDTDPLGPSEGDPQPPAGEAPSVSTTPD